MYVETGLPLQVRLYAEAKFLSALVTDKVTEVTVVALADDFSAGTMSVVALDDTQWMLEWVDFWIFTMGYHIVESYPLDSEEGQLMFRFEALAPLN